MEIDYALDSISSLDDFAHSVSEKLAFNPKTSHILVRTEPIDTKWLRTCTQIKSNFIAECVFELDCPRSGPGSVRALFADPGPGPKEYFIFKILF